MAKRGDVTIETKTYSLDEALQAYDDLHEGCVRGRGVIVPRRSMGRGLGSRVVPVSAPEIGEPLREGSALIGFLDDVCRDGS